MKLLLTSAGITNPAIERALADLLEKPYAQLRSVFIPTAANGETGDKAWVETEMNSLKRLGFATFDVVDISASTKKDWYATMQDADIIGVGGGNDRYLLGWFRESGLAGLLPELLKTKVYMGISAGSIVTASHVSLNYTGILYYEQTKVWKNETGLGLVDFEIRPHLNSPGFPKVCIPYLAQLAEKNPVPFYAIDDNSAVKVDGKNVTVVSEGQWKKFH